MEVFRRQGVTMPEIRLDMHLIHDLHLLSDDATETVLLMQDRTGIKPPLKEWNKVGTVGGIVELLLKYAPQD